MIREAVVSDCGTYRTWLERSWSGGKGRPMIFAMLNPSTADAEIDDPTIRRCIGFADREGCGGIVVVNLFSVRATDPRDLKTYLYPIGPENVKAIGEALLLSVITGAPFVVACGAHAMAVPELAKLRRRAEDLELQLYCLGKTKSGAPRHPLYLPKNQPLQAWP